MGARAEGEVWVRQRFLIYCEQRKKTKRAEEARENGKIHFPYKKRKERKTAQENNEGKATENSNFN